MKNKKLWLSLLAVVLIGGFAYFAQGGTLFQGKLGSSYVTKAEFAYKVYSESGLSVPDPANCEIYEDVPKNEWFSEAICSLTQHGIMGGMPDGTFGLQDSINRAEAAKIVHQAFDLSYDCPMTQLFSDLKSDQWYYEYINQLGAYGFFQHETKIGSKFNPGSSLSSASLNRWFASVDKLK